MKKITLTMVVTASILMMISSACAVPHVTYNEMKRISDEQIEKKIDKILNSRFFIKLEKSASQSNVESEKIVKKALNETSSINAPYYPKLCELLTKLLQILRSFIGGKLIGKMIIFTIMFSLTFTASVIIGILNIPNAVVVITAGMVSVWASFMDELKPYFILGLFGLFLSVFLSIPIAFILYFVGIPILVIFNIFDTFLNTLATVYGSEGVR